MGKEQKEEKRTAEQLKKILELMKANAKNFSFKDTSELYMAAEELYWDSYYKSLGYKNQEDYFGRGSVGQTQMGCYDTQQTGFFIQPDDNKVNPEFANIAQEAKANAADDEKAIEEMKKKHLKK